MKKIRLICATRATQQAFFTDTALGRSLQLYNFLSPMMELQLFPQNTQGLPAVYNQAIENASNSPAILIFIHDDVHICDFFWSDKIIGALQHFQIIGLAGNKRRLPGQPGWLFINDRFDHDERENLSGVVGHGSGFPCTGIAIYGPVPQECLLLDGLMLASDSETLLRNELRFDTQFLFHFYDMDFCRQAEKKGVKMGTWPISMIHESGGAFGSEGWKQALETYRMKYPD